MSKHADRLLELAQLLDELSEDGPPELLGISEELGEISEAWPEVLDWGSNNTTFNSPFMVAN